MKETRSDSQETLQDELLPEYDLDYSKAKPNRFASRPGVNPLKIVALDDDVAKVFRTPEAVNEALRTLIKQKGNLDQLASLMAEFADEDRALAEAGMADYANMLKKEDQL